MASFIRAKQGQITRLTPHQGNRRFIVRGGKRGLGFSINAIMSNSLAVLSSSPTGVPPNTMKQGTQSIWFTISDDLVGVQAKLFYGSNALQSQTNWTITKNTDETVTAFGQGTGGSLYSVTTPALSANTPHNIVVSFDSVGLVVHVAIDGVVSTSAIADEALTDLTRMSIGGRITQPSQIRESWDGLLGQARVAYFEYHDLRIASELAKFVTGTGTGIKGVNMGANGELPSDSLQVPGVFYGGDLKADTGGIPANGVVGTESGWNGGANNGFLDDWTHYGNDYTDGGSFP
jgi:hypothetical protein